MNGLELMLAAGTVLRDRYNIIKHLGGGAFGQAYLAEDHDLPGDPWCVVKQFKPQRTDTQSLWTAKRLFDTEAEVLHRLGKHAQIPTLLAHFEEDCEFYLVQDYIEGDDLSQTIQPQRQQPEADIIVLLQDVLEVLQFVHQEQVIHRDIKPSNLIRRRQDNRIVLIDFGAVKQIAMQPEEGSALTIGIGTKGYIPSEQANGRPKPCSDLYALGILCIQALTGCKPEELEDAETAEIVWRDQVQVTDQLADLLDKMVRYDFRQRYQSTEAVLADLNQLTQAFQQQPQGLAPICNQGDLMLELGNYAEALTAYDAFLQTNPKQANVWRNRGRTLSKMERYETALSSYDRALQLNADDPITWFGKGAALQKLQLFEAAFTAYAQVLNLDPEHYETWFNQGCLFANQQDYERAVASYDKALEIKPNFYQAWLNRGFALTALQQYENALQSYDHAVKISANQHEVWLNRGVVLTYLGNYSDAMDAYKQALQLQPNLPEAWVNQGIILEKLNHYQAAQFAYEQALQLNPGYPLAVQNLDRLLRQRSF